MTDEEKAEEIANERCRELMCWGRCNIHKNHHCGFWHYNYECALKGIEYGLAEGRESVLKELLERVEKDQSGRQVETVNILELKGIIKEMGVDL